MPEFLETLFATLVFVVGHFCLWARSFESAEILGNFYCYCKSGKNGKK